MPIVAEHSEHKKRVPSRWALSIAAIALLIVGLFVWSCIQPVTLEIADCELDFGVFTISHGNAHIGWERIGNGWELMVQVPGESKVYGVMWITPR
jgi:hypothetical protein